MPALRRLLLTGSHGFIGRHLSAALNSAGWDVVPLQRNESAQLMPPPRPMQAEALVHLAFPTSARERAARPDRARKDAETSTASALTIAEQFGVCHIVLASSGKVYGPPQTLPITEEHPLRPSTPLGALKLEAEELFEAAARRIGLSASCLRIFNAYGPAQRSEFLIPFLIAALRSSKPVSLGELDHGRDWVHVSDVCRAFQRVLEAPGERGALSSFNVATGKAATVSDLIAIVEKVAGRRLKSVQDPGKLRPFEPVEERGSCEKLGKIGWRPEIALEAGLGALCRTIDG